MGKEIYLYHSTLTISHSDIEGGQASGYLDKSSLIWGAGMIDADPQFLDAVGGDFHLAFDSPCKEAGDSAAPKIPAKDFEGDPRITFQAADMGADEFHAHLYYMGDAVPGGAIRVKLLGVPGSAPVWLFLGAGVLDPPIPSMWGDWYLEAPLIGPIDLGTVPAPKGLLVVPGSLPATPPGPYAIPMQGLIGTELTNLCILQVD